MNLLPDRQTCSVNTPSTLIVGPSPHSPRSPDDMIHSSSYIPRDEISSAGNDVVFPLPTHICQQRVRNRARHLRFLHLFTICIRSGHQQWDSSACNNRGRRLARRPSRSFRVCHRHPTRNWDTPLVVQLHLFFYRLSHAPGVSRNIRPFDAHREHPKPHESRRIFRTRQMGGFYERVR